MGRFPSILKRLLRDQEELPIKWVQVEFLFKKNKVDYIVGKGKVRTAGEVEITAGENTGKVISGSNIMIATGCKPRTLDEVAVDGERVMTSRSGDEKTTKIDCDYGSRGYWC